MKQTPAIRDDNSAADMVVYVEWVDDYHAGWQAQEHEDSLLSLRAMVSERGYVTARGLGQPDRFDTRPWHTKGEAIRNYMEAEGWTDEEKEGIVSRSEHSTRTAPDASKGYGAGDDRAYDLVMRLDKEWRTLGLLALDQGFRVRGGGGGHVIFYPADLQHSPLTVATSPSDHAGLANMKSAFRRAGLRDDPADIMAAEAAVKRAKLEAERQKAREKAQRLERKAQEELQRRQRKEAARQEREARAQAAKNGPDPVKALQPIDHARYSQQPKQPAEQEKPMEQRNGSGDDSNVPIGLREGMPKGSVSREAVRFVRSVGGVLTDDPIRRMAEHLYGEANDTTRGRVFAIIQNAEKQDALVKKKAGRRIASVHLGDKAADYLDDPDVSKLIRDRKEREEREGRKEQLAREGKPKSEWKPVTVEVVERQPSPERNSYDEVADVLEATVQKLRVIATRERERAAGSNGNGVASVDGRPLSDAEVAVVRAFRTVSKGQGA